MERKKTTTSSHSHILSKEDLIELAWASHVANDNLALLCDLDWCANNLTPQQKTAVERWRGLTEIERV